MDLLGLGTYGSDDEEQQDTEQQQQALPASLPAISAAPPAEEEAPRPAATPPAQPRQQQQRTERADSWGLGSANPAVKSARVELQPAATLCQGEPAVGPTRAQAGSNIPESEVPAPSKQGVWSSLPTPKTKRVVQLNLPINKEMLKAAEKEDEEDRQAAKKRKPNPAKSKLTELLPAPRNGTGIGRLALGGGEGAAIDLTSSSSKSSLQPQKGSRSYGKSADSDDEDPMARFGPMPEAGNFQAGPAADTQGDEDTGLAASTSQGITAAPDHNTSAVAAGPWSDPAAAYTYGYGYDQYGQYGSQYWGAQAGPAPEEHAAGAYYVGEQADAYAGYADASGASTSGVPAQLAAQAHTDPGQALFAQALMEEQERASKKGKGLDLSGIQFKEVNQKDLTSIDPMKREAMTNVRSALGPEYAAKLREEAKPFEGDKLSKRKHQIGTLFYNAKMKELEIMEGKALGMRQKSETASKYGW